VDEGCEEGAEAVTTFHLLFACALSGAVLAQVWRGAAFILGRRASGRGWNNIYTEHFIYRDEHPVGFWLMIALQSSLVIFVCWRGFR